MKPENILKVIEVFKKVLPLAIWDGALKMGEVKVRDANHACGTVHCHAGWFSVGYNPVRVGNGYIGFTDGIKCMCEVLELSVKDFDMPSNSVSTWAAENPILWGNDMGANCFGIALAFYHETRRPNGAENLQHIIDHWTEVYERVRATEQPHQPTYSNISKSLAVLPVSETSDVINQPVNEML